MGRGVGATEAQAKYLKKDSSTLLNCNLKNVYVIFLNDLLFTCFFKQAKIQLLTF